MLDRDLDCLSMLGQSELERDLRLIDAKSSAETNY